MHLISISFGINEPEYKPFNISFLTFDWAAKSWHFWILLNYLVYFWDENIMFFTE